MKELLEEEEERKLWYVYSRRKKKICLRMFLRRKYEELSLAYNEVFAKPVHDFFEKVFRQCRGRKDKE